MCEETKLVCIATMNANIIKLIDTNMHARVYTVVLHFILQYLENKNVQLLIKLGLSMGEER